jgi:hypothetical protein
MAGNELLIYKTKDRICSCKVPLKTLEWFIFPRLSRIDPIDFSIPWRQQETLAFYSRNRSSLISPVVDDQLGNERTLKEGKTNNKRYTKAPESSTICFMIFFTAILFQKSASAVFHTNPAQQKMPPVRLSHG